MGGQGRGVLSDFKMTRVRPLRSQQKENGEKKRREWAGLTMRSTTSEWRLWLETFLVSRELVGRRAWKEIFVRICGFLGERGILEIS